MQPCVTVRLADLDGCDIVKQIVSDYDRRHKINLLALEKHGTIEFRHPRSSTCIDEVILLEVIVLQCQHECG
jgi:hypothetical protein